MSVAEAARALSLEEVATALGCSTRYVHMMVHDGRFPKPFRLGRSLRWNSEVVQQFIRERQQAAQA